MDIKLMIFVGLLACLDFRNIIKARSIKKEWFKNNSLNNSAVSNDYTVLIPAWGNPKYLESLPRYYAGVNVVICTTKNESPEFIQALKNKGLQYKQLDIKGDVNPFKLLKEGLERVRTKNVIFLDADTESITAFETIVSKFEQTNKDLCSFRVVPDQNATLIEELQNLEYDNAMDVRFLYPWLTSGAAMIGKASALRKIMNNHSQFFNGGDIEIGKIAKTLELNVGHLPYTFTTTVPETLKKWFKQRILWMSGAVRHNIVNAHFHNWKYPFYNFYFVVLLILTLPFKIIDLVEAPLTILTIVLLYSVLQKLANKVSWKLSIIFTLYCLTQVLVILPISIVYYVRKSLKIKNFGVMTIHSKTDRDRVNYRLHLLGGLINWLFIILITILIYK